MPEPHYAQDQQRIADSWIDSPPPERPTFTSRQQTAVVLAAQSTRTALGRGLVLAEAFIDMLSGLVSHSAPSGQAQATIWMQASNATPVFWNILVLIQNAGYFSALAVFRRLFEQYVLAALAFRKPWANIEREFAQAAEGRLHYQQLTRRLSPPANAHYEFLSKMAHRPSVEYVQRMLTAPQGLVAVQQCYEPKMCEVIFNVLFAHLLLHLSLVNEALPPMRDLLSKFSK